MAAGILARLTTAAPQIPPFDAPAAEFSFCDEQLDALVVREAERAGLTVVDVAPKTPCPEGTVVAISDDTLVSAELLTRLHQGAGNSLQQVCVATKTPLYPFLRPFAAAEAVVDDGLRVPLFAGPLGGRTATLETSPENWFGACDPVLLDDTTAEVDRTDPYGPPPHTLLIPASVEIAGRVTHWLHALNLGLVWTVLLRRRHGALGRKNKVFGKVKIHPTALVEGSLLHDGAEIEAGASVLNSYIGPQVKIADHAVFVRCAVDTGCHTLIDTHMRRVVAYAGSTLSNLGTSDLLLGRKIFITTGVAFFHPGPGQSIIVDGEDTLRPVLGGAVGHGAILGARSLLVAGQAVPSGTTVVGRPDEAISRLDDAGLARAHTKRGDPFRDV